MNPIWKSIFFATIAATGNALFVLGQKKSEAQANPFIFLSMSLSICIIFMYSATFLFQVPDFKIYIHTNWKAILTTATGLFITYLGFYFLYSRFGASHYTLYAVISILTTSILVGVVFFKETFNIYYLLSAVCALFSIILFYIGKK